MKCSAGVGAALAALALAACGATPLSVTQLRTTATRICSAAVAKGNRIPGPSSPAASAGFLRQGVPILTRELKSLRALRPPSSLASDYATATGAFSEQLGLIEGTIRSMDAGADPVVAFKQLQSELAPIESRGAGAWQTLGIPACVNQ